MRIKKLELIGFKSFKDRTVIQFDKGITGVVGPNGCGKSNIVDALVWVMGEMSAKHLRGSSMEDVIFAGSDGYAPSGLAEVSLVLENDGGPFPAKYMKHSEVMVTRRLHRSGESEYLINKEGARLKDIQEIFMDTGAGSKGFSIIEQGAIGRIITAKPEDRRTLIEEAAGITKFKSRKRESQRKLVSTEQNLTRLNDIIGELKRQLDSMQRQVQRAERYKKLKEHAQELDLFVSSFEYLEVKAIVDEAEKIFNETQSMEIEGEADFSGLQTQVEELKVLLSEKENSVNDHQLVHVKLKTATQELDRYVTELKYKIEQGVKSKEMTGSILSENQKREELLLKEKEGVDSELSSIEQRAESLVTEYEEKKTIFEEREEQITEMDQDLTLKRRELMTVTQAASSIEAQVEGLNSRTDEMNSRLSSHQSTLDELSENQKEFSKNYKKVAEEFEKEKQLQLSIMSDVENFESNRQSIAEQVERKESEVEEYKDNLNEVTGKLYGLENLDANFEGFQEGVKNIMLWQKQKKTMHADGRVSETAPQFQPMADVVEVKDGYEVAMEAALGNRLQMLLGEGNQSVVEAVDYLKSEKHGRSSFLSNDFVGSDSGPQKSPSGEGVVTLLKEVVSVPEKYSSQVGTLLDDVVIVDSVRTALKLRPEYQGWSFVTPDGDVLDSFGVLSGGSAESADSGVLKRKKEIKELTQKKDEWAGKLSLAQLALGKLEEQLKTIEEQIREAREEKTKKEIYIAELKKDVERTENELKNVEEAMNRQTQQVEEMQEKLSQHQAQLLECGEKESELKERRQVLEDETENLSEEILTQRMSISHMQEEVAQLQAESAAKTQACEGLRRQQSMLQQSITEVQEQLGRMGEESTRNSEELTSHQTLIEEKRVELEKQILREEESEQQLSSLQDEFEQTRASLREVEDNLNQCMRDRSDRQTRMNEAQLKLDQSKMQETYLIQQVEERYAVDLSSVAKGCVEKYIEQNGLQKNLNLQTSDDTPGESEEATVEAASETSNQNIIELYKDFDLKPCKTELEDVRRKMNRIGEVNLSALEEFGELEERYNFLSQQHEDLVNSKEQLRKVIDKINRICSKRFKETFEAVNERFEKVFPVLFGGGEARLVLIEDPEKDDVGVDIIAKPPGKKMTSVTLMSGGEKALTSVSLIFSIFLVKPSPFCLLDEVDAPLDDANVSRFNDLVREMAKRSQIIVVTHNKHTMQVNKKLYGVTMEEKGVSKMVSVSLEEAEKVAQT